LRVVKRRPRELINRYGTAWLSRGGGGRREKDDRWKGEREGGGMEGKEKKEKRGRAGRGKGQRVAKGKGKMEERREMKVKSGF